MRERKIRKEVRKIGWQRRAFSTCFSSVVCSPARVYGRQTHLEGSLTCVEMGKVLLHLSLVSPTRVLGLHKPSLCAPCACNPRISLPSLIDWGPSTIVDPYRNLEVTQRFSKVEDLEPYILSPHSLSVYCIDWVTSHVSSGSEIF